MGMGEQISLPPESSGISQKNKQPWAISGSWHRREQRQRGAQSQATPSDWRIYGGPPLCGGQGKSPTGWDVKGGGRQVGTSHRKPFHVREGFFGGFQWLKLLSAPLAIGDGAGRTGGSAQAR